jgi:hypothetical protein
MEATSFSSNQHIESGEQEIKSPLSNDDLRIFKMDSKNLGEKQEKQIFEWVVNSQYHSQ